VCVCVYIYIYIYIARYIDVYMYIYVLPQHYFLAGLGLDFTGKMEEAGAMTRLVNGIYTYIYIDR